MFFDRFDKTDIPILNHLQPEDWNDIAPHFNYYLENENCTPLKLSSRGQILAVGAVIRHESTAWLAHIIVDKNHRNMGLGKSMTSELINCVDRDRYRTISLIATPLGYPVYKSLGFTACGVQNFYKSESVVRTNKFEHIRPFKSEDLSFVLSLDECVSGEQRARRLLQGIENAWVYEARGEILGFYLPGLLEGPVFALSEDAGLELMKWRMVQFKQAIVPSENIQANNLLRASGMSQYRDATRMYLGEALKYQSMHVYNRFSGQIG